MRHFVVARVVSAVIVAVLVAVGCAEPTAPTPAPTTAPAPGTKAAEAPKVASTPTPAPKPTPVAAAPTKAPEEVTVKYGELKIVADSGIYIAIEKGYFKQQGIKVETVPFVTAADMLPALATGQLDAGGGSASAGLFNAMMREIPIKLVADKGSSYPGGFAAQALVVRKPLIEQGKVKDYQDLKGLKIAITAKGNSVELMVAKALEKGKLTPKDVELVVLSNPDMGTALNNGAVDAGSLTEPFVTQGADKGWLVRFKDGYDVYPNQLVGSLAFAPGFMKNGADPGNRFMIAYLKGVRDYNDAFGPKKKDLPGVISILTKYTSTKDASLLERAHPSGLNPDGYMNLKGIDEDMDWYVANGYLKERPKASDIVDHQYVDNAIKVLGKYQP